MVTDNKVAAVQDYVIKCQRLCIPFAIVYSATPASKTYSSDLGAAMCLAMEGQTSAAAAIDSGTNFTTPNDANGIFGVLLYNLGTVQKLHTSAMTVDSGTVALTSKGASSTGVTASGNIAISADWSGSLASTSLAATISVDYIILDNSIPALG